MLCRGSSSRKADILWIWVWVSPAQICSSAHARTIDIAHLVGSGVIPKDVVQGSRNRESEADVAMGRLLVFPEGRTVVVDLMMPSHHVSGACGGYLPWGRKEEVQVAKASRATRLFNRWNPLLSPSLIHGSRPPTGTDAGWQPVEDLYNNASYMHMWAVGGLAGAWLPYFACDSTVNAVRIGTTTAHLPNSSARVSAAKAVLCISPRTKCNHIAHMYGATAQDRPSFSASTPSAHHCFFQGLLETETFGVVGGGCQSGSRIGEVGTRTEPGSVLILDVQVEGADNMTGVSASSGTAGIGSGPVVLGLGNGSSVELLALVAAALLGAILAVIVGMHLYLAVVFESKSTLATRIMLLAEEAFLIVLQRIRDSLDGVEGTIEKMCMHARAELCARPRSTAFSEGYFPEHVIDTSFAAVTAGATVTMGVQL
ncbi:hypothetical protein BU15DRAFT_64807 [Melanogaster broomeanus]|nr:hypothetical protein BU15DRAFT_64807 [Melanogaster broomeanus]